MQPNSRPMLNMTLKQLEQLLRPMPSSPSPSGKTSHTQRLQQPNAGRTALCRPKSAEIRVHRGTWEPVHMSGQTWTAVKSPTFLHMCPEE